MRDFFMGNDNISESDLVQIFSDKKEAGSTLNLLWTILRQILFLGLLVIAIYAAVNFNALKSKFLYWYKIDYKAEPVIDESAKIIASQKADEQTKKDNQPDIADNTILIKAINVQAPVTWQVDNTASAVSKNLENGTIQINGTSLPGEKGNIYITGHSSNYSWAKGGYNNIFALLDKIVVGDYVFVKYNGTVYTYRVTDQLVVLPTQTEVMNQTSDSRLTLATCWPVGTSLKRLIVVAQQVYPDPKNNKDATVQQKAKKLPAAR